MDHALTFLSAKWSLPHTKRHGPERGIVPAGLSPSISRCLDSIIHLLGMDLEPFLSNAFPLLSGGVGGFELGLPHCGDRHCRLIFLDQLASGEVVCQMCRNGDALCYAWTQETSTRKIVLELPLRHLRWMMNFKVTQRCGMTFSAATGLVGQDFCLPQFDRASETNRTCSIRRGICVYSKLAVVEGEQQA